jgi:hypothetical protein
MSIKHQKWRVWHLMFLRIHLKKAFNTKYHEGTKEKNWNFQNKFNPKNVCCPTNTVPLLNSTVKTTKQVIWLAQEASTWFGPLIPFNHWKTIIILWYKMVIKEVYTIPTFSDISTNLKLFALKPNHFLFKLNFGFFSLF